MLYSYKNQYPQPIPFRIRLSDGSTRTDPQTFTPEEILDAGFVAVPDMPPSTEYQTVNWDGVQWIVTDFNQLQIEQAQDKKKQELIDSIVNKTQQRLDDFARTRAYDGILSACTYVTDTNIKFSQEGQYCVQARSNTWATLYQILAEVESGTRPVPNSYFDIEPFLPVLQWPQI